MRRWLLLLLVLGYTIVIGQEKLTQNSSSCEKKLESLKSDLAALMSLSAMLNEELTNYELKQSELNQSYEALKQKLDEAEKHIQLLKASIDKLERNLQESLVSVMNWQTVAQNLELSLTQSRKSLEELTLQWTEYKNKAENNAIALGFYRPAFFVSVILAVLWFVLFLVKP